MKELEKEAEKLKPPLVLDSQNSKKNAKNKWRKLTSSSSGLLSALPSALKIEQKANLTIPLKNVKFESPMYSPS